jgi:hypothetical protein
LGGDEVVHLLANVLPADDLAADHDIGEAETALVDARFHLAVQLFHQGGGELGLGGIRGAEVGQMLVGIDHPPHRKFTAFLAAALIGAVGDHTYLAQ